MNRTTITKAALTLSATAALATAGLAAAGSATAAPAACPSNYVCVYKGDTTVWRGDATVMDAHQGSWFYYLVPGSAGQPTKIDSYSNNSTADMCVFMYPTQVPGSEWDWQADHVALTTPGTPGLGKVLHPGQSATISSTYKAYITAVADDAAC